MKLLIIFFAGKKIAPSVPALVAIQEIQAGDPLEPSMFKETKLAKAGLPDGIITPGSDLSSLMARHGMSEGDILRQAGVIDNKDFSVSLLSARLTVQNDPNLRAVEVPIEAAAGMLAGMKAGDRVDVISVSETSDQSDTQQKISQTIIENAKVIGVSPSGESSSGVLIIAVSPEQAETFFLARVKGKVFVSLRPFGKGE